MKLPSALQQSETRRKEPLGMVWFNEDCKGAKELVNSGNMCFGVCKTCETPAQTKFVFVFSNRVQICPVIKTNNKEMHLQTDQNLLFGVCWQFTALFYLFIFF